MPRLRDQRVDMSTASANAFTPTIGAWTVDPRRQAWMDALATACVNCEHKPAGKIFCRKLDKRIDALILAAQPFCPLDKHNGIRVDTTGRVPPPLRRPTEAPRPPWLKRWFGPRLRRLMGRRRRVWLATKPPHYISGGLKLALVITRHCRPKPAIIKKRLTQCLGDATGEPCEALGRKLGLVACRECGCFVAAKVRLARERCPKDKWDEATGDDCRWWRAFRVLDWIEWSPKGCSCGGKRPDKSSQPDDAVPASA